ncbi:hypothetical protein L207DRAFT_59969 [Hyaloscypha variabilis F]|uniref:Uncharacterized protein n=1 Tax=Hyaloscypha variabilis (strain UAMH 11265 / GT02V1 / F) TaxID=1149755 RepID=A0A2J6RHR3_HYAVF|nr:hypothetical protein L207DRAFT_59969 [Hyaloscypha variabilis F]
MDRTCLSHPTCFSGTSFIGLSCPSVCMNRLSTSSKKYFEMSPIGPTVLVCHRTTAADFHWSTELLSS